MKKIKLLLFFISIFSAMAMNVQAQTYRIWTTNADFQEFTPEGALSANITGGTIECTLNGTYPRLDIVTNIDAGSCTQLKLVMKNETPQNKFKFIFYKSGVKYSKTINPTVNNTDFETFIVDLTAYSDWTGTIDHFELGIAYTQGSGLVTIDVIEFLTPTATHDVTISTIGQGSVSPNGGTFTEGSNQSFTATPDAGWQFAGWTGDVVSSENPLSVSVNSATNLTATFELLPDYDVTISLVGQGSVSPNGGTYVEGSIQAFTATADSGWQFAGWTGDVVSSENPLSVAVNSALSLTATFELIPPPEYDVTINLSGQGTVSPNGGTYTEGTIQAFTATADAGWVFTGWTGDVVSSDNPLSVTVNSALSLTANFVAIQHDVTINVTGLGSVSPNGGTFNEGSIQAFTATAGAGWGFTGWTGDVVSSENPLSVTVNSALSLTATFDLLPDYDVTISLAGQGTVSPNGGTYTEGSNQTFTATADAGYEFTGWTGDVVSALNPLSVTVDSAINLTASFELLPTAQYDVTISLVGQGTVSPNGGTFIEGSNQAFTAVADAGWVFAGWTGDIVSSDNPLSVAVSNNLSITATFVEIPDGGDSYKKWTTNANFTLFSQVSMNAVIANDKIACTLTGKYPRVTLETNIDASSCTHLKIVMKNETSGNKFKFIYYKGGTKYGENFYPTTNDASFKTFLIDLTTYPDWSGTITEFEVGLAYTISSGLVTIDEIEFLTPAPAITHNVTINTAGQGLVSPNGGDYYAGINQAFTAVADAGWEFSGWTGDVVSSENPLYVTVNSDVALTANFVLLPDYDVTISLAGQGTVSPNGGTFVEGSNQAFTATADYGWEFNGWTGDVLSSENPLSVTVDSVINLTANFLDLQLPEHDVTISLAGQGSVSPNGGTFLEGSNQTFTATADVGWEFTGWTGDVVSATNPLSVTVNSAIALTANFEALPDYDVTINLAGQGSVSPNGGTFTEGSNQAFTATADAGWEFAGWTGDVVSALNPLTITVDSAITLTATFLLPPPDYDVTISVAGQGSVSPNGGTFLPGTNLTYTATADAGYEFTGWSGDITSHSNPLDITVDSDISLTASFAGPPVIPNITTPSGFYCNFASASNVDGSMYNFWNVRQRISYTNQFTSTTSSANCVRIVGGLKDGDASHTEWYEKDNSFDPYKYDPVGDFCYYDWTPLIDRVHSVVDNSTLQQFVIDNVPWAFLKGASFTNQNNGTDFLYSSITGANLLPPHDAQLWNQFIQDMCTVMIDTFGIDVVSQWRFRVGSEIETPGTHWLGTVQDYLDHYKNTINAVHAILPNAKVGAHFRQPNFTNSTVLYSGQTVRSFGVDWMQMCQNENMPFDFMAISWYPQMDNGDCDVHEFYQDEIVPFREHSAFSPNATFEIHEFNHLAQVKSGNFVKCYSSHNAAFFAQLAGLVYDKGLGKVNQWGTSASNINTPQALCIQMLETMEGKERYASTALGSTSISSNDISAVMARTDSTYEAMVSSFNVNNDTYQSAEDVTILMETTLPAGTVYVRNAYITKDNCAANVFLEDEPGSGWILSGFSRWGEWVDVLNSDGDAAFALAKAGLKSNNALKWTDWTPVIAEQSVNNPNQSVVRIETELQSFSVLKFEVRADNPSSAKSASVMNNIEAVNISELKQSEELLVYPNPSQNGKFILSRSEKWSVYSITGSRIKEGEGTSVDLSSFRQGIYFLKTADSCKKLLSQ